MTVEHYIERVLKLAPLIPRPGVVIAHLAHDADCPKPEGAPCTCEPEIRLEELWPKPKGKVQ